MKIVLVHNRYRSGSPGGEDRVVSQERAALVAAGHDVVAFERSSDDIAGRTLAGQALVPPGVVWNPRAARQLGSLLSEVRPDVVHLHNLFPLLSPSVLAACREARIPTVATLHNYLGVCPTGTRYRAGHACDDCVGRRLPVPAVRHGCYRGSSLATLPLAASMVAHRGAWQTVPSAYLFLSQAQRRFFASLALPEERCFVKPNLVRPPSAERTPEPLVVYLGRLAEVKGLRVLMRAWDRFTSTPIGGGVRLAVAGTGPLEPEVRAWAATRPSVDLHGLLDAEGCERLLLRAAAAVVPSEWQEPFGLVVAEAMAAGVPPLATAHGSFEELVTDGVDGLLYPPGDDAALAALLGRVFGDLEWAGRLGALARQTWARRFAPPVVLGQLEAAYRFAVEHPRQGHDDDPVHVRTPGAPRRGARVEVPGGGPTGRDGDGRDGVGAGDVEAGDVEAAVAAFWEAHPCGDELVGGLSARYRSDFERFFDDYDRQRYASESHIPACLDRLQVAGARVLEIGLGEGAESEQLIRRGARWTGLDLTEESVGRVRARLALRGLPYDAILRGSATDIPAPEGSFDLVFSHGVLHHVPDIAAASREIHRVLRPGGRLVVMLYARHSLNYWLSIALVRRLALVGLVALGPMASRRAVRRFARGRTAAVLVGQLENARRQGLVPYLRMSTFVHANTDGPENPHSRVYDLAGVRRDFPSFEVTSARKYFLHAPPLPVHGLPGARMLGWHLWVELVRRDDAGAAGGSSSAAEVPAPQSAASGSTAGASPERGPLGPVPAAGPFEPAVAGVPDPAVP